MNRGVDRQNIYRDREDRQAFLHHLHQSIARHQVEIHAYCLMGNHYHLLVHTPEPNLDVAMRDFTATYARNFNQRHRRDGPLFRSRYQAITIERDRYLLAVSRYVHRNPKDLGATDLAAYEWSSLGAFVGVRQPPSWLTMRTTLDMVGSPTEYASFVALDEPTNFDLAMAAHRPPTALGSPDFTYSTVPRSPVAT